MAIPIGPATSVVWYPHGLQFAHIPGFLRVRAPAALDAVQLDDEEGQSADRKLPFLCSLEPALRCAAVGLDASRLVCGAEAGPRRKIRGAPGVDATLGARQSRPARILQIWGISPANLQHSGGRHPRRL